MSPAGSFTGSGLYLTHFLRLSDGKSWFVPMAVDGRTPTANQSDIAGGHSSELAIANVSHEIAAAIISVH
jgi:hypothetical protein